MKLTRVVNCLKLLNWETAAPSDCPLEAWIERLLLRGAKRLPQQLPGLPRLRYHGHEILFVMRSGRVAIRLDYTTPHHERRHAAEGVFVWLVEGLHAQPDAP